MQQIGDFGVEQKITDLSGLEEGSIKLPESLRNKILGRYQAPPTEKTDGMLVETFLKGLRGVMDPNNPGFLVRKDSWGGYSNILDQIKSAVEASGGESEPEGKSSGDAGGHEVIETDIPEDLDVVEIGTEAGDTPQPPGENKTVKPTTEILAPAGKIPEIEANTRNLMETIQKKKDGLSESDFNAFLRAFQEHLPAAGLAINESDYFALNDTVGQFLNKIKDRPITPEELEKIGQYDRFINLAIAFVNSYQDEGSKTTQADNEPPERKTGEAQRLGAGHMAESFSSHPNLETVVISEDFEERLQNSLNSTLKGTGLVKAFLSQVKSLSDADSHQKLTDAQWQAISLYLEEIEQNLNATPDRQTEQSAERAARLRSELGIDGKIADVLSHPKIRDAFHLPDEFLDKLREAVPDDFSAELLSALGIFTEYLTKMLNDPYDGLDATSDEQWQAWADLLVETKEALDRLEAPGTQAGEPEKSPLAVVLQEFNDEIEGIESATGRELTEDEKQIILSLYFDQEVSGIDKRTTERFKEFEIATKKTKRPEAVKNTLIAMGATALPFLPKMFAASPKGDYYGTLIGAVIGGTLGAYFERRAAHRKALGIDPVIEQYNKIKEQDPRRNPDAPRHALLFLNRVLADNKRYNFSLSDRLQILAFFRRESVQALIDSQPDRIVVEGQPLEIENEADREMFRDLPFTEVQGTRLKIDEKIIESFLEFFQEEDSKKTAEKLHRGFVGRKKLKAQIRGAMINGAIKGSIIGASAGLVGDLILNGCIHSQIERGFHAYQSAKDDDLTQAMSEQIAEIARGIAQQPTTGENIGSAIGEALPGAGAFLGARYARLGPAKKGSVGYKDLDLTSLGERGVPVPEPPVRP